MYKLKITRKCFFFILLLIPFFELYSFDMLINMNVVPFLFRGITIVFSLCRILISALIAADYLYNKRVPTAITTWAISFYCIACVFVSYLNGSLYFKFVIGNITYIGFALLCERLIRISMKDFNRACIILFGLLCAIGVVTTFLMPYGFFRAESKAYAVYFLGSKNSFFYYSIVFLYFFFFNSLWKKDALPKTGGVITFIFLLNALICDSSNSLLCLLVIGGYYIVLKYGFNLYKCISAKLLFVIWIFLALFIVFSASHPAIQMIVSMVGRNTSYSGRDVLWEQAIEMFLEHPFTGNGIFSEFKLKTGIMASHAHNFYLDILAKYGIYPLLFFLGAVVLILIKCSKTKNRKKSSLAAVTLFIILLHNIFDDITLYFIVLLFLSFEIIHEAGQRVSTKRSLSGIQDCSILVRRM